MEKYEILVIFASTIVILYSICALSYKVGTKIKDSNITENSEIISTSIFGLLALFVSFSYSMAVTRYENRRQLAVAEANAISTAYFRSSLLKPISGVNLKELYLQYINSRILFYENNYSKTNILHTKTIKNKLEDHLRMVTVKDRSALESAYTFSLTEMFDTGNARNYALIKTLPKPIYVIILIVAIAGFGAFNYDLGFKKEKSQWKLITFIVLFSLLYTLIYDIDHASEGFINISQDSIIEVRDSMMLP